jgi:hypothetical protein
MIGMDDHKSIAMNQWQKQLSTRVEQSYKTYPSDAPDSACGDHGHIFFAMYKP